MNELHTIINTVPVYQVQRRSLAIVVVIAVGAGRPPRCRVHVVAEAAKMVHKVLPRVQRRQLAVRVGNKFGQFFLKKLLHNEYLPSQAKCCKIDCSIYSFLEHAISCFVSTYHHFIVEPIRQRPLMAVQLIGVNARDCLANDTDVWQNDPLNCLKD